MIQNKSFQREKEELACECIFAFGKTLKATCRRLAEVLLILILSIIMIYHHAIAEYIKQKYTFVEEVSHDDLFTFL